jgi:hypothetical protein
MQLITNRPGTKPATTGPAAPMASAAAVGDANGPDYVGKHRPHRLALLRQRVRVSQLANRQVAAGS